MNSRFLIISLYSHPEFYPPTLNAIEHLAAHYKKVIIIHRNIEGYDWKYPSNVELVSVCKKTSVRQAEQVSSFKKAYWFLRFTFLFFQKVKTVKPDTVLLYDPLPTLSWRIIHRFVKAPRFLWYHNHDVIDLVGFSRMTLIYWAYKSEKWIFPYLDIFSLPSIERKAYFPMDSLKGSFFFIPNYPSLKVYDRLAFSTRSQPNTIRILFQGSIGPFHGIEEIIGLLDKTISNKEMVLVLKGFVNEQYKSQLNALAKKHNVDKSIIFLSPSGYSEVVENTYSCDIGIGIHMKNDIMNKTLGTASNKIYEYAACGMPVLLYDNNHFRETLGMRKWTFFTNVTLTSLWHCIEQIEANYLETSKAARNDFVTELCFERYFSEVISYLKEREQ